MISLFALEEQTLFNLGLWASNKINSIAHIITDGRWVFTFDAHEEISNKTDEN